MLSTMMASIPSPSSNAISLGPIDLRAYGFLIACGVLAGVWLASRRLAQDGLDPEIIPNLAMWVLPAAIIGARAYFVLTNWHRYADDLPSAFQIWQGGLGIPGGVLLGLVVGVAWLRYHEVPPAPVFTAVGLSLPLGQIIGRFGNYFNQELYGRPTDLPWGLEIDRSHRLTGYEQFETFHPTFAYEILWNIALFAFLMWLDRKRVLKPGALFAVYLIGYGIGRVLIELVRIDPVNELLGIRLHIWAMLVFMAAAAVYLARSGFRSDGGPAVITATDDAVGETADATDDDPDTDDPDDHPVADTDDDHDDHPVADTDHDGASGTEDDDETDETVDDEDVVVVSATGEATDTEAGTDTDEKPADEEAGEGRRRPRRSRSAVGRRSR